MPSHRRGRSLSEALTLERSDNGGLFVSSINSSSSARQGLKEGDELLGATINFDQLSKDEVLKVLKLMEPFDDKVQVLTRNNLSKSLGNLDECCKSPEAMLNDSYNKLYNAKIKKFMRDDLLGAEESCVNGAVTAKPTVPGSSKVSLKHDMGLPRLGVDFGLLKTKTLSTDVNADSQSDELSYERNLNLPPLGLGNGTALSGAQLPRLKVDAKSPQLTAPEFHVSRTLPEGPNVNTTAGMQLPNTESPSPDFTNLERPQIRLEGTSEMDMNLKGSDVNTPDMGINLNGENITGPVDAGVPKMPRFKLPNMGLSGPSFSGQDCEVKSPNVGTPEVPSGKLSLKNSKRLKNPDLNVDDPFSYVESPKLKLSGRSPDLQMPGANVSQLEINGPECNMSLGQVKVPSKKSNIEVDVKTPDLSLKTPKIKGVIPEADVNLPTADLNVPNLSSDTPSVGIKGPARKKYKAPKFTMPKFDFPDIQVPGFNGDVVGPDVQLASPHLKTGFADPNVDLKVPSTDLDIASLSGKPQMPGFGLSHPKVRGPEYELKTRDMDVSAPKYKGGIHFPGVDPDVDLKHPKLDLNTPNVDMNMPSGKLDIDEDAPSGKLKLPKFKLFGTLPKKKDVDINAGVKTPELTLKSPKIKGMSAPDVSVPNVDLKSPNLDLHSPDVNIGSPRGNFTMPTLKIPSLDVSGPKGANIDIDASLNRPDLPSGGLDLSKPVFDIDEPTFDLKGPRSKLKMPDMHIDAPSSKPQIPKFDLSGTLPKGPNVDINTDLKSQDLSLKAPKITGGIDAPNLDLKAPKLDVNTPTVNIGSPKAKLNMPKFKKPEFSYPNLKGPEIDGNFDGPDINAPNVNLRGSKPGFEMPNIDLGSPSGKLKKPNFNLPDFGLSGPKLDGRNLDLKSPDLDLSSPDLRGGINAPDINMPKIDLKSPKLDLNAPKLNLDMPSGKLKMPELHAPDWDVKATSGKMKLPKFNLSGTLPKGPNMDLNTDVKSPDLSLKAPKIKGGIDTPDFDLPNMDLRAPKLDVNTPDVNIGSPKSKLKMPKLKMPKFSFPSLKGPDIDGNFDSPGVDLNAPNVNLKGPKGNLDVDISGPSGKYKKPNFNLPDFGLSGPKLDGPNLDLKSPDLDLSGPDLRGGINAPDINMPKVDLKSPKLDLNAPKLNLDMPSGKLKMPELHAPDWDVKAPSGKMKLPKFNLSGTLPKGPNMDLNTDLKSPDLSLKAPTIKGGIDAPDFDLPNMSLKSPKLDVNTPDVNIGSPKAKLKMPKLKMAKFSLPSLKGPEIDGNLDGPNVDLNAPNVNLKGPKGNLDVDISGPSGRYKKPNFNLPDFGLSGPKLDGPNLDFNSPDLDLSGPDLRGGINAPDINMPKVDLKSPKLDLNAPKLNLDMPSGKLKMPELHAPDWDVKAPSGKMKLPKFNLSGTLPKGPNMDLNTDLKSPDLSLKAPTIKGGVDAPDFDLPNMGLKSPKLDVNTPDVNIGSPKTKFKMPKLRLPKFNFPSLKGPDIDGNLDGPDVDVNAPNVNLKGPKGNLDVDISGPSGKYKKPNFNLPDFGLSGPKLDGPNLDLKSPDLDLSGPDLRGGINAPDINMPKLKMPKVNLPNLKGPEIDGNFDGPGISAPNVNLRGSKPGFEMPNIDFGSPSGKLKKPHLKIPDVGFSVPKLDDPNLDFKSPDLDFSGPDLRGGIKGPNFDLKSPNLNAKLPTVPNLNMNSDLKTPDLNLKAPKIKGGIDAPKLGLPDMDIKAPKFDMNTPGVNVGFPDAKFEKPQLKMPKVPNVNINGDLQGPDLNFPNIDVNGPKRKDFNFSGPKLKGPGISMPDLDLPDARFKGPKLDLNAKRPDLGINGSTGRPHMNLTAPQVKGGIAGPDSDMTVPSGNFQGPQTDFDFANRKFKLPSVKLPQLGSPDVNRAASDIDFGASLRPTHLDFSPPNTKLNMKPPQVKGNITGSKVSAPKMDLSMQRMRNPQMHVKSPDFNLDDPSLNFRGPSYNNRRSDITGVNMKMPALDIDGDVRLHHIDRKSSRTKVRSSFPAMDAHSGHHIDFNRSDLNIDDFTGKDHVLRARGAKLDLQASHNNYGQMIHPSGVNIGMRDPRHTRRIPHGDVDIYARPQKTMQPVPHARFPHFSQDSRIRVPDGNDGYYVTVFPNEAQNQNMPNHKYNTLGGPGFHPKNVHLEVPSENDLKGSTFFFSNLI